MKKLSLFLILACSNNLVKAMNQPFDNNIFDTPVDRSKLVGENTLENFILQRLHIDDIIIRSHAERDLSYISIEKSNNTLILDLARLETLIKGDLMRERENNKAQKTTQKSAKTAQESAKISQKPAKYKRHLLYSFFGGFGTAALCGLSWLYANNYVKLSDFKIPFRA